MPIVPQVFSLFQITLHVAYVHAFVNPTLFLVLHRGLRQAALDLCCGCCAQWGAWLVNMAAGNRYTQAAPTVLPPPPQPPATSLGNVSLLKPPLPPNNKPKPVNRTIYMYIYLTYLLRARSCLMNQKVHYHLHKVSPPVHYHLHTVLTPVIAISSQINLVAPSYSSPSLYILISSSHLRLDLPQRL